MLALWFRLFPDNDPEFCSYLGGLVGHVVVVVVVVVYVYVCMHTPLLYALCKNKQSG
jgi:hypothetical protein